LLDTTNDPGRLEAPGSFHDSPRYPQGVAASELDLSRATTRGLRSGSYDRGRFSPKRENGVFHFQSLVREFLTAP
jgi:hypothetical protein